MDINWCQKTVKLIGQLVRGNEPPHIAANMMQPGQLRGDINFAQIGHLLNGSELLT